MVNWEKVMEDLAHIRDYFLGCMGNAAPGSEAKEKFAGYVATIVTVAEIISEQIGEEDDGK